MTQHNFGDQVSFITWPVQGGDTRAIVTGEFRGYAGASSMAVLVDGAVRFVPVSNEIDPDARCVCGYFGSAHVNGFASTNQPDGACPWRYAVDGPNEQVYAWFEVATATCRHGSLIYTGAYCQACDEDADAPEPKTFLALSNDPDRCFYCNATRAEHAGGLCPIQDEPEVETRAEHRLFREGRNASEAAR